MAIRQTKPLLVFQRMLLAQLRLEPDHLHRRIDEADAALQQTADETKPADGW